MKHKFRRKITSGAILVVTYVFLGLVVCIVTHMATLFSTLYSRDNIMALAVPITGNISEYYFKIPKDSYTLSLGIISADERCLSIKGNIVVSSGLTIIASKSFDNSYSKTELQQKNIHYNAILTGMSHLKCTAKPFPATHEIDTKLYLGIYVPFRIEDLTDIVVNVNFEHNDDRLFLFLESHIDAF